MTNDIGTLATALYVRTDDLLIQHPDLAPWRPKIGLQPQLTDAELVTLAVMQALLGYTSEARWVRHARAHLGHLFRYLPGYNRRLRAAAGLITALIRAARGRYQFVDRRCAGGRFHPGGMRPLQRNSPPLGPGRLGRILLLRQPLAVLLQAEGATAMCGTSASLDLWLVKRPLLARPRLTVIGAAVGAE